MLPYAYHAPAPAVWTPDLDDDPESELQPELCVVRGEEFFLHGIIRLEVLDGDDDFDWGVWVSLSPDNYERAVDLWDTPGRETEPPYFGWLTTELPTYARSTLLLKTSVHTRPVGLRPLIVLEPTDHPLAVEQREGITVARLEEIAAAIIGR